MEQLNLNYKEVFEQIPYRNLLIMQYDKLREEYGEVMEEVTEAEFFNS